MRTLLTLVIASTFWACGTQETSSPDSKLSGQSCNYSAYESCITDLILMNPDDPGYLAKKIKCDMIWARCNN